MTAPAGAGGGWRLYLPPSGQPFDDSLRPGRGLWPCPATQDPQAAAKLVVLVSAAADLAAARDVIADRSDRPTVLWAWLLPEALAIQAEDFAPVVYATPMPADLEAAWERGAGRTTLTATLAELEHVFGFDPNVSVAI